MFTLLKKLTNWFESASQKEREAYLSKSSDIFDLESRIRNLENRKYN